MKVRRTFMMWWTLSSILFVAFIAVRHASDLKRQFEQASAQQQFIFERTKEKAAPVRSLFGLTAIALGPPLGLLAIGLALIWASGVTARSERH